MPTVARINVTPVKALGLQHPAEVDLTLRAAIAPTVHPIPIC